MHHLKAENFFFQQGTEKEVKDLEKQGALPGLEMEEAMWEGPEGDLYYLRENLS